jgi:hypothetical protein
MKNDENEEADEDEEEEESVSLLKNFGCDNFLLNNTSIER